ncbi:GNAT family N-acetyltransferase [soil metagenome]
MATEVVQDAPQNRFQLLLDGQYVGETDYILRDDTIASTHTEIDPGHQGEGLAAELVRGALNLVRAETDLRVVAKCPYMSAWIGKHPDYQDLLTR